MHLSIYARAVEDAREAASARGHKLGKFDVIRSAGYATCETCSSGVSVLFHAPPVTLGNAVDMPCKHGEPRPEIPAAPAPPSGEANPLPKRVQPIRVQPTPPAADDVPWFMRDKVPATAGER